MGFGVWSHVEFSQPSQNSVLRWQHGRSYFHRHIQRLVWTKNGLYDGHYDLDRRHHYRIFRRKSLSLDGHSILCWSLVTCLPYCSRGFQVKRFHVYLQPPSSSEVYWEWGRGKQCLQQSPFISYRISSFRKRVGRWN